MSGGNGRDPGGDRDAKDLATPVGLVDLAREVVGELADVSRIDGDDGAVWQRAGRPFASLAAGALEVRLQPPVARAALRTPDTSASPRGEGWVRFAPSVLDRFAADRAAAWLESAWRHAAD
jgi:hypothetical protein